MTGETPIEILKEKRLRELGKEYGFETDQQRTERILKKIFDEQRRELEKE